MRMILRVGCGLLGVALAACSSSPPRGDQASADKPTTPSTAQVAEVRLTTVKWPGLESAIAAQKGKVVVLDVWGSF